SRRDSATGSESGPLSRREEEIDVASILGEVHDSAAQHVRGIVTARIEAHRGADLLSALRLVDVTVQANHRLVPLDHVSFLKGGPKKLFIGGRWVEAAGGETF